MSINFWRRLLFWLKTGEWISGNEPYVSPSEPMSEWPAITTGSWSPSDAYETGVQLFLDLSTGHISYSDWKILQDWDEDSYLRVLHHEYGLIMWVPQRDFDQGRLPSSVRDVVSYAQANSCWLINFDQDAEVINGLNYYEW
jgi:hypothetical protein